MQQREEQEEPHEDEEDLAQRDAMQLHEAALEDAHPHHPPAAAHTFDPEGDRDDSAIERVVPQRQRTACAEERHDGRINQKRQDDLDDHQQAVQSASAVDDHARGKEVPMAGFASGLNREVNGVNPEGVRMRGGGR